MTSLINAAALNPALDWSLTALFIVFTIAVIAFTVWLLIRNINNDKNTLVAGGKINAGTALLVIILMGVLVRIALAFISAGNRSELQIMIDAAEEWSKRGASEYIRRHYSDLTNSATGRFLYPLAYYYVGLTAGSLISVGLESSSVAISMVLKLPLIISDAVLALVIYKIGRKYRNEQIALIMAAFVCFCPLFIFASAVWTSVFSVLSCLLVISFYALVEKKHVLSIAVYSVSMLVAKEASYLFPIYLVYYAYTWFKAISAKDTKTTVLLPLTTLACVAAQYLISLPLTVQKYSGEFFQTINVILLYPLTQLNRFSDNALSIYNVFMKGGSLTNVLFRSQQSFYFIIAFALIAAAVTAVVYFGRKNRALLTAVASFVIMLYHVTYFDMTATSVIPSIALLLLSFALLKEKRLLKVMFAQTVLTMTLMCLVYASAGYFNHLPLSEFASTAYEGHMQLTSTTWGKVCAITLSVLSIGLTAYFTKVIADIALSDKVCPLGGKNDMPFTQSIAYFIK